MAEIVGQRVSLHSLKGRPELNGCEGVAISFDSTTGRLGIRVDGEDKPLALKPENLSSDGVVRKKVEVKASAMTWLTKNFRDGSVEMRHRWFIDVYRTRVDTT